MPESRGWRLFGRGQRLALGSTLDVFISYKSEDRERVRPLAQALEKAKFTVWWDEKLQAGETYDAKIEQALADATCALVVWTEKSVKSDWVRSEATAAHRRKILIPVLFDQIDPPLAFTLVQAENMIGWSGQPDAAGFQRLLLQIDAMVAQANGRAPSVAADLPDGRDETLTSTAAPGETGERMPPTWVMFLLAGLAALATAYAVRELFVPTVKTVQSRAAMGMTAGSFVLFFIFYWIADREFTPQARSLTRRWLFIVPGGVKVNAAEAFDALFEAEFGRKHFSLRCLSRSFQSGALFFVVFSVAEFLFHPEVLECEMILGDPLWLIALKALGYYAVAIPTVAACFYVLLGLVRLTLRRMKASGDLLIYIALVVFSSIVYFALVTTLADGYYTVAKSVGYGVLDERFSSNFWDNYAITLSQSADAVLQFNVENELFPLVSLLLTLFMPLTWLWLVLIVGPVTRFLIWDGRRRKLKLLGRIFEAQEWPVTAMGGVLAALGMTAFAVIAAVMIRLHL